MNQKLPTNGQLERNLSQGIQKLYRQELEHSPSKVTCKLFDSQLAIVIEDALTAVEKTLIDADVAIKVVDDLNATIGDAIKSKLKALIEQIMGIEVKDILFDSTLETGRTGAIATFNQPPQTRDSKPAAKS